METGRVLNAYRKAIDQSGDRYYGQAMAYREQISPIETKEKTVQDSLPGRIVALADKITSLKKEISGGETTLKKSETSLENSESELKKVIEAIEK